MNAKKAFTLIEIMIVVVIIGILAVALFPKLMGALGKTADEARKVELHNWSTILIQYKNDHYTYPDQAFCLNESSVLVTEGYVDKNKLPKDPNPNAVNPNGCGKFFHYKPLTANGIPANSYMISATMENDVKGNADSSTLGQSDKDNINPLVKGPYYVEIGL